MRRIGDHAVVLGAGIGGLLAARVLADAYRRVTVVERDPLPERAEQRRGIPHGRHAHMLVPGGAQVLGELFPGLLDDLVTGGVPVIRNLGELRFAPGGHLLRLEGRPSGPTPYQASRPFLEGHVRSRVRALPNVEIVDRCDVVGPVTTATRDRITGVRVLHGAGGGAQAEDTLEADLVLDATGRGARTATWLATIGYDPPAEELLPVNVKYSTRHLRLPPGALSGAKIIGVGAEPGRPTGMAMLAEEQQRWILTVFGYQGHHPPTEPQAFLDFVEAIAPPDVFAAVRDAEPLDEIVTYRFQANLRRRYERLRRFPAGLLAFGDAICSLNPVYGQGMTVAALQAVALQGALADGDRSLATRFFRMAAKPVGVAWQQAIGGELSLPQVPGKRRLPFRIIGSYVKRAQIAAESDTVVAARLLRVAALQDPPPHLFRPSTMRRVVRANVRKRHRPEKGTALGASAPTSAQAGSSSRTP
jgi:2-polyprenyl-6-methoxyphenol hydroxylase-like FAD-dependent oxidoreductase